MEVIDKNEYISKLEAVRILQKAYVDGRIQAKDGCVSLLDDINTMPAADVQPISQWISVKDRLPEPEKDVLVWYRYTWGAGFTSYRFGISKWYSNIKRWYEGYLPKDIEVLYWQPLSEPPKDGDAK